MGKAMGQRIREAREACGLTQNALAEKIGARESQVSAWERGENMPRVPTLRDIARVLDKSVDDLIGDDEDEASEPAPTAAEG